MFEKVYGFHLNTRVFQEECLYILDRDHYIIDTITTGSCDKCIKAYFQLRDNAMKELGQEEWIRRQGILSDLRLSGKINMEMFRR
jgi:hypothetical protein